MADLTNSLSTARNDIKTLSNKLAAARNAEVNTKVPGSALKTSAAGGRGGPSAEVVQAAQAKEDLYGDLTGLIIRSMKHEDEEDIFDCIQTGRNGSEFPAFFGGYTLVLILFQRFTSNWAWTQAVAITTKMCNTHTALSLTLTAIAN